MMGRALLVVGWLATAGFIASGVIGYRVGVEPGQLQLHILTGLVSSLLLLFAHCWIMFYLIGTGRAIKDAVAQHGFESALVERTRWFKNRSYPMLMLAMGLAMATFILGGGVATGVLPPWIHHGLFFLALAAQVRSLWIEGEVLVANDRLMKELDRRMQTGS